MSSPESRAIGYAETQLSVHKVYEGATTALGDLRAAQAAVVEYAAAKRSLIEEINDRVAVVTSDERAKYHELSATAFDQHLKSALQLDATLKTLRSRQLEVQRQHDAAEADVREAEFRLRVTAARMEELGGLLNFYAATKQGRQQVQ